MSNPSNYEQDCYYGYEGQQHNILDEGGVDQQLQQQQQEEPYYYYPDDPEDSQQQQWQQRHDLPPLYYSATAPLPTATNLVEHSQKRKKFTTLVHSPDSRGVCWCPNCHMAVYLAMVYSFQGDAAKDESAFWLQQYQVLRESVRKIENEKAAENNVKEEHTKTFLLLPAGDSETTTKVNPNLNNCDDNGFPTSCVDYGAASPSANQQHQSFLGGGFISSRYSYPVVTSASYSHCNQDENGMECQHFSPSITGTSFQATLSSGAKTNVGAGHRHITSEGGNLYEIWRPQLSSMEIQFLMLTTKCPMYEAFGFCLYGLKCFLIHEEKKGSQYGPALAMTTTAESTFSNINNNNHRRGGEGEGELRVDNEQLERRNNVVEEEDDLLEQRVSIRAYPHFCPFFQLLLMNINSIALSSTSSPSEILLEKSRQESVVHHYGGSKIPIHPHLLPSLGEKIYGRPRTLSCIEFYLQEVSEMSLLHEAGIFNCQICGLERIPPTATQKVGETGWYPYCLSCGLPLYAPPLLHLLEAIALHSKDDYQMYKDLVDYIRNGKMNSMKKVKNENKKKKKKTEEEKEKQKKEGSEGEEEAVKEIVESYILSPMLRIPFTYEAHRLGTSWFSWSLFSLSDVFHTAQVVIKCHYARERKKMQLQQHEKGERSPQEGKMLQKEGHHHDSSDDVVMFRDPYNIGQPVRFVTSPPGDNKEDEKQQKTSASSPSSNPTTSSSVFRPIRAMVSMGSGSGYMDHLFNLVWNGASESWLQREKQFEQQFLGAEEAMIEEEGERTPTEGDRHGPSCSPCSPPKLNENVFASSSTSHASSSFVGCLPHSLSQGALPLSQQAEGKKYCKALQHFISTLERQEEVDGGDDGEKKSEEMEKEWEKEEEEEKGKQKNTAKVNNGNDEARDHHRLALYAFDTLIASPVSHQQLQPLQQQEKCPAGVLRLPQLSAPTSFSVPVNYGAPHVLLSFPTCEDVILLLSWPPFGSVQSRQSTMAYEVLLHFMARNGQILIYIGDLSATGDSEFHQLLTEEFALAPDYCGGVRREVRRWCPYRMGLMYAGNDSVGVYIRREGGKKNMNE